jgi:hypothetical protein
MAASKGKSSSHSVRVPDVNWGAADRRAKREGTNMNAMINEIIEGYGQGYINLPKVTKTYANVAGTAPAPTPTPSK